MTEHEHDFKYEYVGEIVVAARCECGMTPLDLLMEKMVKLRDWPRDDIFWVTTVDE